MRVLHHRIFETANNGDCPSLEPSRFREQVVYQMGARSDEPTYG